MISLTKREREVLTELLKNSKASDQEIAKKLKTSRPTIFKIRKRLEEKGIIKQYFVLADFEKIGLKLHSAIIYRWKDCSKTNEIKKSIKMLNSMKEIIFFIRGNGAGKDIITAIHEDILAYERFIKKLMTILKDNVEDIEVFLASTGNIIKWYDLSSPAIHQLNKEKEIARENAE